METYFTVERPDDQILVEVSNVSLPASAIHIYPQKKTNIDDCMTDVNLTKVGTEVMKQSKPAVFCLFFNNNTPIPSQKTSKGFTRGPK